MEIKDNSYKEGLEAIARLRSRIRGHPGAERCRVHGNSFPIQSDLPIKIERVTLILASEHTQGDSPTLSDVCENLDSSYNIVFAGKSNISL